MSGPPSPAHVLRGHGAQLNALTFSADNERLYSGDASGLVIVTSTRTLRALTSWNAHTDGILGIEEWDGESVITHGRDNKLHVWTRVVTPASLAETAAAPTFLVPSLKFSMDVNALNYCRFSLLRIHPSHSTKSQALLALPNLVESSLTDIWAIPGAERLHAAIGKNGTKIIDPGDGRGKSKTGIIMSQHLYGVSRSSHMQLRLLVAYEDGSVCLFARMDGAERSVEGRGWDSLWRVKAHVESVMDMRVNNNNTTAFTVSADNLLCRYDLRDSGPNDTQPTVHRTKSLGNGTVAIRDDGRVLALGGWDGRVRLYSTRSFKALGTLIYHKEGCHAVAFSNTSVIRGRNGDDEEELEGRENWLATGGKDNRIAIWKLMDFDKK